MIALEVATRFVVLARLFRSRTLDPGELHRHLDVEAAMEVIGEILGEAGFGPVCLVRGRLRGDCLDQDGTRTGDTYLVNHHCPFVVETVDDDFRITEPLLRADYAATDWLDELTERAGAPGRSDADALAAVSTHVEASRPLEPVVLNSRGDELVETFGESARDSDVVWKKSVCHARCRGHFDARPCSREWYVLVCRGCSLRVYVPTGATTFGDLRAYLKRRSTSGETSTEEDDRG